MLKSELGIVNWLDLLQHYPIRYVDRSKFHKIGEIQSNAVAVQVVGTLVLIKEEGVGRKKRLKAVFKDETGSMELIWFAGIKWVQPKLKAGVKYIVFGKPTVFNKKLSISHPEFTTLLAFQNQGKSQGLQAIYPSTEKLKKKGLDSKGFRSIIDTVLRQVNQNIPETLPTYILENKDLISREQAFKNIHQAPNPKAIEDAQRRLKFEELFFLQLKMLRSKTKTKKELKGPVFYEVGALFNQFYKEELPFEPTEAQKRVLKEIRKDTQTGLHMNRLVQGDVGSGKTVVALMSMLLAIDNGYQAAMMAPTEILAQQHFESISALCKNLPINVALLTGSTKQKDRNVLHDSLVEGNTQLLIGTHALIEDNVQFKNLGIAVIDEQHRFGVAQRYKLWKKNLVAPHVLVMTATPIPRTLAMTVYGDLDTSIIDELPPGRKPISTKHYFDNQRLAVLGFIKNEISKGRQIYIVYPLIEESASMDYKDLMDGYESISRYFPIPEYQISIVHGKMKAADKAYEMKRFEEGKTQILVATTVIEVGVNVPNASVMVIESAERFGLSQLHQLRGRVGRGSEQSYCILMTGSKLGNEAKTRMRTMVGTNDGFKIAEVDLKLRGPGDIAGTRQSGILDLKMASIVADSALLIESRNLASTILEKDPELALDVNKVLNEALLQMNKEQVNWGRIS